ncbi:hypothetical protein CDV31_002944 [Fusarium ambrosium]|uniref:UNC-45/Cro1/She4 central domain-containing protein n=1 Tax=Fusarium ambrosium TaxID=131363 RepID=A0A428UV97_9HYPO|nr:hypothetical protein CDV31_002944 [Fusarium ambrosium]
MLSRHQHWGSPVNCLFAIMVMSPDEVIALLQREGSGLSPDTYDEAKEPEDARPKRTKSLSVVLETLQQVSKQPESDLEGIAKALGDGSRDVAWRIPYGESGILEFFLDIIASTEEQKHGVKVHALRIIGNSCADTDENRARVVEGKYIVSIINHLQNEGLVPYLIPVLYNVLVDYEPAQLLASQSRLNSHLISLLKSPSISKFSAIITYFCKILALLVTQDGEPAVADPQTVEVLLKLAASPPFNDDLEDFMALVSTAASYLANETFQENLLKEQRMNTFMTVFELAITQFDEQVQEQGMDKELSQLCVSLLTTLADLTAADAFPQFYPLDSSVPQKLLSWLKGTNPSLQSAGCLALGNLSRSDETSLALVQTHQAHRPLIEVLSDASVKDAQHLHSALSFLKNLAIPAQNKALLGDALEPTSIPRILTIDTLPQVQFSAISLVRLLLVNCAPNVCRTCQPRSGESSDQHTSLHDILSVFDRSDTEPTKLEAARSVAAVCRVLHTTPVLEALPEWKTEEGETDETQARSLFYAKHDLSKALAFLITQEKWPILRSEAWFVFALISRTKEGVKVVNSVLSVPGATDALSFAVTGKAATNDEQKALEEAESDAPVVVPEGLGLQPQQVDPKQKANMTKVDRENCLVLCTEVIKNGEDIESTQQGLLQDLIRQGTQLLTQPKTEE